MKLLSKMLQAPLVLCVVHVGLHGGSLPGASVVGGAVTVVAAAGGKAYVGAGARLLIFEASPVSPSGYALTGASGALADMVRGIAIANGRAFVAAGSAGLLVFDVSKAGDLAAIGALSTPGYAEGVACSGTLALVADGPLGLRVVDVSDPSHPVEVGAAFEGKQARAVAVRSHYAFIAAGGAGLLVADVANPSQPVELASVRLAGHAAGLALSGDFAFVMDSWGGIGVVNIADAARPFLAATYATPGWAVKASVTGTTMAVADAYRGVRLLDISDPLHPVETAASETDMGDVADVAMDGGRVWMADRYEGLRVAQTGPRISPATVYDTFARSWSVAISGNYAYVAAMERGLRIIDISDPARPREVGVYPVCNAVGVTVNFPYVYVSNFFGDTSGFHVVDVSDPRNPKRAGFLPNTALPAGVPRDHTSVGAISYVVNESGMIVIDAGDPANPVVAGFASGLQGSATLGIAVRDHFAYMAQEGVGLLIFDVSDPHAPKLVGTDTQPNSAQDVALLGNYAMVAGMGGLSTVDVSNPAHPHTVASGGSAGRGVSIDGPRGYLATNGAGIQMLDLTNPGSPTVLGTYRTPGYARKGVVQGGRLWIADAEIGLWSAPLTSFRETEVPEASPASPSARLPAPMHPQSRTKIPELSRPPMAGAKTVRRANQAASSCTVSSTDDTGAGTFRECLTTAGPGDTITFDVKVFPPDAPRLIWLRTALPPITQGDLTIDASNAGAGIGLGGCGPGLVQPADFNGLVVLSDGNRIQGLEITCVSGASILVTGGASHNTIGGDRSQGIGPNGRGNLIRGASGIVLSGDGTRDNVVIGNDIGAMSGSCVAIAARASANRVGSTVAGERNIVSQCGPGRGVDITGLGTTDNVVIGNYLGVDASGNAIHCSDKPNCAGGLFITDRASRNRVGGMGPGERNVISGSGREGVGLEDFGTVDNVIIGNYIGTDATGTRAVPNVIFGIWVDGGPSRTRIEGNLISGNIVGSVGVSGDYNVVVGNVLGTDVSGKTALGGGPGFSVPGERARFTRVGGVAPGEANLIAGASEDLQVSLDAPGTEENYIIGNRIGTDITGAALPVGAATSTSQPAIKIEDGAKRNVVGGSTDAEANLIAGSPNSGIRLSGVSYNAILGNWIGANQDGVAAIGNRHNGIDVAGADHTFIMGNRIAANAWFGVDNQWGAATTIRGNAIHDNGLGSGIVVQMSPAMAAPAIGSVGANSVSGTACASCVVEVFSDAGSQGGYFEGATRATAAGIFTLVKPQGFQGPHFTATATGADGLTSQFSSAFIPPAPPLISISMTHAGALTVPQSGRIYSILVANSPSSGPTSDPVTVTETLSVGMTLVSMSGAGWNCQGVACQRSDVLNPGASYPPITIVVNVAANAPAHGTDRAAVSGGGSAPAAAVDSAFGGSIAHLASAGGWDTTITLLNLSATQSQANLDFFDESGQPLSLPVQTSLSSSTPPASSVNKTLGPNSLLVFNTTGSDTSPLRVGSAQLSFTGIAPGVGGFATFKNTASGQEAAVPLETRNTASYFLAFDNTGGVATGVAMANVSAVAASIPVTILDENGATLQTGALDLSGQGHTSFALGDRYPVTVRRRGTVQFSTPTGGQIAALGLRFSGNAVTTIPVLAPAAPTAGSLTHIAVGGGWQTTITLINMASVASQANLKFYDDSGAPLPLALNFPQSGASLTSAVVDRILPAGATLVIAMPGSDASPVITGSATLSVDGAIGGFAVFRANATGQEAVVPLEYRAPGAYVLAFDNTDGLVTGMALANISTKDAIIPVTFRDETGARIGSGTIGLPALGHTSFTLTTRYDATVNRRGSAEFHLPAASRVSALGLRFTPTGAFTTVPVLAR